MKTLAFRRAARLLLRDGEGSALVESVIVLPVLFILMFGVFEFSWLFYQQHLVSTGLRDGARYLARTSDPTDATFQSYAERIAATGTIASGGTARVTGWTAADVTCTPQNVANPVGGTTLEITSGTVNKVVTCSTSFAEPTLGLFGYFGISVSALNGSHSERAITDAP